MIDFSRKRISRDEATLSHLRSLKSERQRLGLTQKRLSELLGLKLKAVRRYEYGESYPMLQTYLKLAEIFGWDVSMNPNYMFYCEFVQTHTNRMNRSKKRYAYSNRELSDETMMSEESVRLVIKKKSSASVSSFMAVTRVFAEEAELTKTRREILRHG